MAAAEGEEEAMAQPSAPAQDAEDRTAQDPASASGREEPAPAPGATQPQLDSPLVERLLEAVEAVAAIPGDYRNNAHGRHFAALARRVKLLAPLFEELRDGGGCGHQQQQHNHQRRLLSAVAEAALRDVGDAVRDARDLLVLGTQGSKIWLVLEGDQILKRFQEVTSRLEHALDGVPFDELDISDEVREQVELVHSQLKRAKERIDLPDADLYTDLLSIYNSGADDTTTDNAIVLRRLADKLQLTTIADLKQESVALQEMVIANGGEDPGENIEKMCMLLKKIKDYVQTQNPEMGALSSDKAVSSPVRVKMPVIPDDFRCPISLELMNDPVIVSTGQTYERDAIEKWLQAGHSTCPKTQETLNSKSLTPNYVLRSLIAQWCEANGLESPKRPLNTQQNKAPSCSCSEHAKIVALVQQLSSSECDDQRSAASQLRLLAKCNADNRICIADAGAIPLLVSLLPTPDPGTQEHAVTALLNLSIYEENKGIIVSSEAVPGIVHVLKKGSMEARENAAATLFSLSVIDEYKVRIGAVSGAIPALALLLKEGTQRGKKDAATALFNLCIYQGNKGKAIRAGVIPTLMSLLTDPAAVMVDEALAILAILASHPEGKVSIGAAKAVPVLVGIIGTGSSRSRENAAAILVHLFSGEQQYEHLIEAQQCGVMPLLFELAQNGTDRGKRKANDLIERLNRFLEQQELVQSLSQAPALAEQSNTPFPATLANK